MAIEIYTDGSAKGNPGKGGYGIVMKNKDNYLEISNGYRLTTNNRMELLAVIVALEKLENTDEEIIITSDSKYVIDSITKGWVYSWVKKNASRPRIFFPRRAVPPNVSFQICCACDPVFAPVAGPGLAHRRRSPWWKTESAVAGQSGSGHC